MMYRIFLGLDYDSVLIKLSIEGGTLSLDREMV